MQTRYSFNPVDSDSESESDAGINIGKFVDSLRNSTKQPQFHVLELLYPVSSASYSPYALKHAEKGKPLNYFMLMTERGVIYVDHKEQSFTPLDQWYAEYKQYRKLRDLAIFQQFRLAKLFYLWRKLIKIRKFRNAANFLQKNLFFLNDSLRTTFIEIRTESLRIRSLNFVREQFAYDLNAETYARKQIEHFKCTFKNLIQFRDNSQSRVLIACLQALNAEGFMLNENLKKRMSVMKKFRLHETKMTFIQKDRKKQCCLRLTNFIILIDYLLIVDFLIIMNNSIDRLLKLFDEPNVFRNYLIIETMDDAAPNCRQLSLDFTADRFSGLFQNLLKIWEQNLANFELLLVDQYFVHFKNPILDGKPQDRICGSGPNFTFHLQANPNYSVKKQLLFDRITSVYRSIDRFIDSQSIVLEFYCENLNNSGIVDVQLTNDLNCVENLCAKYANQLDSITKIEHCKSFDLIEVNLIDNFIEIVRPESERLLTMLHQQLPQFGRLKNEQILNKAFDIYNQLSIEPSGTLEIVRYLDLMDQTVSHFDHIQVAYEFLCDYYRILKKFNVRIACDDLEQLQSVESNVEKVRSLVRDKTEFKTLLITNLNKSITNDVAELRENVRTIRRSLQEPWLVEKNSDSVKVRATLADYQTRLETLKKSTMELHANQKKFKMEVTRFSDLDETIAELNTKLLLWTSSDEWQTMVCDWYAAKFHDLSVDQMLQTLTKFTKIVLQLEKVFGADDNRLLNELRQSIDTFKDKMNVIGSLRNGNLCPRHWLQIEKILGRKVNLANVQLADFEAIDVYDFDEQLNEIAAVASSEAALSVMLKKVDDLWQNLEFVVVPFRQTKDVFILGPIDDCQAILDETIITINTIASSKYVQFIKGQVDVWLQRTVILQKILDQWLYFQQNWLYLESIFSAPDIQRQLANESVIFANVDRFWKNLMRSIAENPLVLNCFEIDNLYENFVFHNGQLDTILKCIEKYLETKRMQFPRFYFLSNDELLEILAQTKNPQAVQNHLRKCFDAINRLDFGTGNEIFGMISPENEYVRFSIEDLKARGNVEHWLAKVESAMFATLRTIMKTAFEQYGEQNRLDWLKSYPSQIVLIISQIAWSSEIHGIFANDAGLNTLEALKQFERKSIEKLNELARLVCDDLDSVFRRIVVALITIDVHARDTVANLIANEVRSASSFEWLKMLRYYWQNNECVARMSNACHSYGYEYLGAAGCLVITPLTDKCYLCLMGALQMDLGGAPSGPAGTGKTETTKDLAKSLAVQCVVFNCSDDLDFKMMGRFFSGLAQCGSWCCFDEFNRIDIEVLSVIAQQLITIKNAKVAKLDRFWFENREIKLLRNCAAFITMNPGYAGRTELPDNLKSLFRPVSMMIPDYAIIAEVTLYSEGFEQSKLLARKMVFMYKLCSEQLSQQDHYDFGMRAVKSVLVMAGQLKRSHRNVDENVVLICALRDSNLPKFLKDDAILFRGILRDLFPGVSLPEAKHEQLEEAIVQCMCGERLQLTLVPDLVRKVIQFHETLVVRWGVMLVGPTGGGKSTILKCLQEAYNLCRNEYGGVQSFILNPKSISSGELYGEINPFTLEWKDGLLGSTVRNAVQPENSHEYQWIVCDGPVDAAWIENLNTVLDDNKMLCLANSERIKLTTNVRMIFEVQDLAQASPATVSRCGMIYVDPGDLKWLPYVTKWLKNVRNCDPVYLFGLFEQFIESGLCFVRDNCKSNVSQIDLSKIAMLCTLVDSFLAGFESAANDVAKRAFSIAYLWSIGGNLIENSKLQFERFLATQLDLQTTCSLWDLFFDEQTGEYGNWQTLVPDFVYNREISFFDTIVPTFENIRFSRIAATLVERDMPVLMVGGGGVGKTTIAKAALQHADCFYQVVNISAQTTSRRIQELFESKLVKKSKSHLIGSTTKRLLIFLDDVNMPKLDTYGSQPPIELLRQYLDYGGLYDREKLFWKQISGVVLMAACSPPGSGGRNALSARFLRHFAILDIPDPNRDALRTIFGSILNGFFADFTANVSAIVANVTSAAIDIYCDVVDRFLPTPEKAHYVFNLRDLSKLVQGMLQANCDSYREREQIYRLFYHENLRVYYDRLVCAEDQQIFCNILRTVSSKYFGPDCCTFDERSKLLFGDFLNTDRIYEEISDVRKLQTVLIEYLDDFNMSYKKEMRLIFFDDAIEHCVRISRTLRTERGHVLVIGVGGSGKQSLTKLAAHLNGFKYFQIELSRNYTHVSFLEDLRKLYYSTGVADEKTVFIINDNQIVDQEFLEDINNMLNSGQVPNLFENEEFEKILMAIRSKIPKDSGISDVNREAIFEFFIGRVRNNLRLVLCVSPIGSHFRHWCRMFPSLINLCTIDWFFGWPNEALFSVADENLAGFERKSQLAELCVLIHKSSELIAARFHKETQRFYYVTPNSFLELLKLYRKLYGEKREIILRTKNKFRKGLLKLDETNKLVNEMKIELESMKPKLDEKSRNSLKLLTELEVEKKQVDLARDAIRKDEIAAQEQAEVTRAIANEAENELKQVMPIYEAATKALDALNKNDINELKAFQKPPKLVQFVTEAVCVLLNSKTDWNSAKILLTDVNFLKRLKEYDKNNIGERTLQKLRPYIEHKDFRPEVVARTSKVCKSICMWVRALDTYAKVYKEIEPKIVRQHEAEQRLKEVMQLLRSKQNELKSIEDQLTELETVYDRNVTELRQLEAIVNQTAMRLNRANKLTLALEDEQIRWNENVQKLDDKLIRLIGDILLAAACASYLGPLTYNYRKQLIETWLTNCNELQIEIDPEFDFVQILSFNYEIRTWNTFALPRDQVSIENAVLTTKSNRWPLIIDPQEQANRWIKQMEASADLKVIKLTDSNYVNDLKHAILIGAPVLLEDVGEQLDAVLDTILLKQTFVQNGRLLIRFADTEIEYDSKFRFYMTTKLANPHYLPEISTKVTLINFTVTKIGLEDQLLTDVVRVERPDLERQRVELVLKINSDQLNLESFEDKILNLLFASSGNILDDEELIDTLNECKETSMVIATRLRESKSVEEKLTQTQNQYRRAAKRGSVLFFTIAQLIAIDPMYQFSLKYFNQLFNNVVETSERSDYVDKRLEILCSESTRAIFRNVSRGLFENHKFILSLMLCLNILRSDDRISAAQIDCLLVGRSVSYSASAKCPISCLDPELWTNCCFLEDTFAAFANLTNTLDSRFDITIGDFKYTWNEAANMNLATGSKTFNNTLNTIEKLLLIKMLQKDKLLAALVEFVRLHMGAEFIENEPILLRNLFVDMSKLIPLIFILSPGSDPLVSVQKFALDSGFVTRLRTVSLGQGQGPIAEQLIEQAFVDGDWVFLQNCHLATSWMTSLEKLITKHIPNMEPKIHNDFRLFLSSMPTKSFPIAVLQNSVKVTNELPKGIKANLMRAFADLSVEQVTKLDNEAWKRLVFGLSLFHAILIERKKFGSIGWNIAYEFNDSDRLCASKVMEMFAESYETINWTALDYTLGEITYGGRVTDAWDLRLLKTILKRFLSRDLTTDLSGTFKYNDVYYCPASDVVMYVQQLPMEDAADIFGMHENATLTFALRETEFVCETIGGCRDTGLTSTDADGNHDQLVWQLLHLIRSCIKPRISMDNCEKQLFQADRDGKLMPLSTVLLQEIDRYNRLTSLLHRDMNDLAKSLNGLAIMSDRLERIYRSLIKNQVAEQWSKRSYPSLKSLVDWIDDLNRRQQFIEQWLRHGQPCRFWFSGFYFPQSFLTGILQTFARKHSFAIDELKFDFVIDPKSDAIVSDAVVIYGLYVQCGTWHQTLKCLTNARFGQLIGDFPAIALVPSRWSAIATANQTDYLCPLYKTVARVGTLSTTGHSTNFVMAVRLPTDQRNDYWILQGTALFTQLS